MPVGADGDRLSVIAFADPRVAAKFSAYAPEVREKLMAMRQLVFEVAASLPEVGEIEESLRWGEPAYLTSKSGSGTTIRMDAKAKAPGMVSVFVHCQTNLIARFQTLFADEMQFIDNREIRMPTDQALPLEALRFCFAEALTYHLTKKSAAAI